MCIYDDVRKYRERCSTKNSVFQMFGRISQTLFCLNNEIRSKILLKISRVQGIRPDFEKSALPNNPYIHISGNCDEDIAIHDTYRSYEKSIYLFEHLITIYGTVPFVSL